MLAYMVNEYYIFTSYKDMSSHIHDIIHHTLLPQQREHHSFSILTGHLDTDELKFKSDNGNAIPVCYENDIYYSL